MTGCDLAGSGTVLGRRMAAMNGHTVTYDREEDGWWVAAIPDVPGCHTQARTLRGARRRIREALGLYGEDADTVELIDEVRLPQEAREAIDAASNARERAAREHSPNS